MVRRRAPPPSIPSDSDSDSELSDAPASPKRTRHPSSDKENASGRAGAKATRANGSSRRRNGLRDAAVDPSQALHNQVLEEESNLDVYDPDQPAEERREVRKDYRALQRKLDDSKSEYLQPENDGLLQTFLKAEKMFKNVKQTSDATLDSRLLVGASDLFFRKVSNMVVGSHGTGIDVDEFVGKSLSFMRNANNQGREHAPDESDDEADDDALDWAYLGRMAGFRSMKRPAPSDFLLGPMAVQKKSRVQKARKEGLGRRKGEKAVQPVEMSKEAGTQDTQKNLIQIVRELHDVLYNFFTENEIENGFNLYKIVINPESFSQTIENIFYVAFLVKEGRVAIYEDDAQGGIPVLELSEPAVAENYATGLQRQQMIFSLTMWEWKEAIEVFDITEGIIPTRPKQNLDVGANGWYT
ncbi:Nse4 C-terminal-domain-containing protein [Geopyxis carbonaria]|nr:Nse4 C-terminal-domain-containing protein [Geopyxis carbonaria]